MNNTKASLNKAYYTGHLLKLSSEFCKNAKGVPSADDIARIKNSALQSAQATLDTIPPDVLLSDDDIISSIMLSALLQNIAKTGQTAETLYEPGYISSLTGMEEDVKRLRARFCHAVGQVRQMNGGEAPSFMKPLWDDCCCENGAPIFTFR